MKERENVEKEGLKGKEVQQKGRIYYPTFFNTGEQRLLFTFPEINIAVKILG